MFDYIVSMKGLETIPLKTTKNGALELIKAFFDQATPTTNQILQQIDQGVPFTTSFLRIESNPEQTNPEQIKAAPNSSLRPKKVAAKKSVLSAKVSDYLDRRGRPAKKVAKKTPKRKNTRG